MTDLYSPAALWIAGTFVFVFGACIGSFLNVCIYRIPEERSIVRPRSQCRCGQAIRWYDNIPIISWFVLKGKARCCGSKIPFRYVIIEALTGMLFLLLCLQLSPLFAVTGMLLFSGLIVSTFIDLDHMFIPDRFTIGGVLVGAVISFIFPALHVEALSGVFILDALRSLAAAGLGAMIGSGMILWLALITETILRKEAMGFGDVKLMGAIGAFCGWKGSVFALFGGASVGAFLLAIVFILQKVFGLKWGIKAIKEDLENETEEDVSENLQWGAAIPFGPWLALGTALYWLYLRGPVDQYLGTLQQVFFS